MPTLRVIRSGSLAPAENMALDERLLAGDEPLLLRLYRWSPPGLSLGRFQDPRDFAGVPGTHVLVRRATGGGAIYHDDELTYALVMAEEVLPVPIAESYTLLHGAIRRALAGIGVPTEAVTGGTGCRARPCDLWCFATPGRGDLVTLAGKKIVGSAQRRVRRPRPRVLCHGSIVLTAPAQTPFCGAVADHVDPRRVERELEERLVGEFTRLFAAAIAR